MPTFVALDTETTGLEPSEHRFVEVYASLHDLDTGEKLKEFNQRIDPQRSILADAQRVHGISAADLIGKPTWNLVGPKYASIIAEADFVVAHNGIEFDGPFINSEFNRIGLMKFEQPIVDTMQQARWATATGKLPTLGELCFACEVDYDTSKAHAADYDVGVMVECFMRGLRWGFFKIPEIIKERIAA